MRLAGRGKSTNGTTEGQEGPDDEDDEPDERPAGHRNAQDRLDLCPFAGTREREFQHLYERERIEQVTQTRTTCGHLVRGQGLQPEVAPGRGDAPEPAKRDQCGVDAAPSAFPRRVQRADQEEQTHEAHGDALEDAKRARIQVHDVLRVERERHEPDADGEGCEGTRTEGPAMLVHRGMVQCGTPTLTLCVCTYQ